MIEIKRGSLMVSTQDIWEYQDMTNDKTKKLVLISISSLKPDKVSMRDILSTLDKLDYSVHITRDIILIHQFVNEGTDTYDFLVNFLDMLEVLIEGEVV